MFLFIVGLEMQPSRLWSLRQQIFGLGSLQVVACGALLTAVGRLGGLSWPVAFVAAMGFVLTSTAIVMQIIEERGVAATEPAQRLVAILLLEDLADRPAAGDRRPARAGGRGRHRRARAGPTSASPSARSPHSSRPASGCSTRCSACSPGPGRARS